MKVFLSTSFSGKVTTTNTVEPAFRSFLEAVLQELRAQGHRVFCAIEDEGWKIGDSDPTKAIMYDLAMMRDSDLIFALVENQPPSAGVQFELGMAFVLGMKIIMAHRIDEPLPYFDTGLVKQPNVSVIMYKNSSDLIEKITIDNPRG